MSDVNKKKTYFSIFFICIINRFSQKKNNNNNHIKKKLSYRFFFIMTSNYNQFVNQNTNDNTSINIDPTQYAYTNVYTNVFTEGQIFGELSTYLPNVNRWKNPLMWIQLLIGIWNIVWLIIFIILAFIDYDWINNWDALLGYVIGYAILILVVQGKGLWDYMLNNDLNKSYQNPSDCVSFKYATHFMGHAHTKVLVKAYIVSVITGVISVWIYWSWLCKFKGACNYTSGPLHPNPLIFDEFTVYSLGCAFSAALNLFSLIFIIDALLAHHYPLRALNHLIKGVPIGPVLLPNSDGTLHLHNGFHTQ